VSARLFHCQAERIRAHLTGGTPDDLNILPHCRPHEASTMGAAHLECHFLELPGVLFEGVGHPGK
jgi:hypothetical protein